MTWRTYEDLSKTFLDKHRDVVLHDTFHQLLAMLLYPPKCKCGQNCTCIEQRKKIVFSLNVDLFNRLQSTLTNQKDLYTTKLLLQIPEDQYFRENWIVAFPLHLIHQALREKERTIRRIDQIGWGLLRLAKTYQACGIGYEASVTATIELITDPLPIKNKDDRKNEYLGSETFYHEDYRTHKFIFHLISAFQLSADVFPNHARNTPFYSKTPEQIAQLLECAHWFRKKLSALKIPNVSEENFFSNSRLQSLPPWVNSDQFDVLLEPFENKLQELENSRVTVSPAQKVKK